METKVAAFCQEIAGDELARLAADKGMTEVLENARTALASGDTDARLEADLDALDMLMKTSGNLGMYPPVTRSFKPLPGASDRTGARGGRARRLVRGPRTRPPSAARSCLCRSRASAYLPACAGVTWA